MNQPDGLIRGADGVVRCWWPGEHDDYLAYHDDEWGRPVTDDTRLFEKLCLEGFQSGLSWLTILRKRENFRRAFRGFVPDKVARFSGRDVERLLGDAGIVRHRGKIEATISNARRVREVRSEFGSFAKYVWGFAPGRTAAPITRTDIPATTEASTAFAKDLKRRGFRFCGPTTVYALMQAMGMVGDHLRGCAVRRDVERERREARAQGQM